MEFSNAYDCTTSCNDVGEVTMGEKFVVTYLEQFHVVTSCVFVEHLQARLQFGAFERVLIGVFELFLLVADLVLEDHRPEIVLDLLLQGVVEIEENQLAVLIEQFLSVQPNFRLAVGQRENFRLELLAFVEEFLREGRAAFGIVAGRRRFGSAIVTERMSDDVYDGDGRGDLRRKPSAVH